MHVHMQLIQWLPTPLMSCLPLISHLDVVVHKEGLDHWTWVGQAGRLLQGDTHSQLHGTCMGCSWQPYMRTAAIGYGYMDLHGLERVSWAEKQGGWIGSKKVAGTNCMAPWSAALETMTCDVS